MNNQICKMTGASFPLFAFSHCRDVVVAVSRAGGFGVLGGSSFTPEMLEVELKWIDDHIEGRPYGIDILIPENQAFGAEVSVAQLVEQIPQTHRDFVVKLLAGHGVEANLGDDVLSSWRPTTLPDVGEALMDVAFRHPIKLIANALGIAPRSMIERARRHGVPVAALVGAKEHAIRQVNAGVDIVVAQGAEAGGHCGEVSTLVLVPEVIRAIRSVRDVPVLAAGGIMTGEQMAACMSLGAQGVWTGSVWLATTESETSATFRNKMITATSRDTVRSRARTGKPARQLRSAWHDAWESAGSPSTLPLPLMPMLSQPALAQVDRAADAGNVKAQELVTYFVGQGVGLIEGVRSARRVVEDFKEEFAGSVESLLQATGDDD